MTVRGFCWRSTNWSEDQEQQEWSFHSDVILHHYSCTFFSFFLLYIIIIRGIYSLIFRIVLSAPQGVPFRGSPSSLRGAGWVWHAWQSRLNYFAQKVCHVCFGQPSSHGPKGNWSLSSPSRSQMKLICSSLAIHHHRSSNVTSQPSPRCVRLSIPKAFRLSLFFADIITRAISAQPWRGFLKFQFFEKYHSF